MLSIGFGVLNLGVWVQHAGISLILGLSAPVNVSQLYLLIKSISHRTLVLEKVVLRFCGDVKDIRGNLDKYITIF